MSRIDGLSPLFERDRLLVVRDPGGLADQLRARYGHLDVAESDSYLAAIAALAERPACGLVVGVDPDARKLERALGGLRKAAGRRTRIVLCCQPSGEPVARSAQAAGADDYLICPARGRELDEALALTPSRPGTAPVTASEADAQPTWEEVAGLAEVLSGLTADRDMLLERLCRWISEAMRSPDVRIVTATHTVAIGDDRMTPALCETIPGTPQPRGQIFVGPRAKSPFTGLDVEKLRHYTRLAGHLLETADRQRVWQSAAFTDEVTGLPNRRYLLQSLDHLLKRAAQQRFRVTLLLLDLDGFKHFNDTYGHAAGDELLRESGILFRKHCRQHDIVARYGGDEFVIVFWDAERPRVAGSEHPRDVQKILQRIKKNLRSHAFPRLGPEATGCITMSGGLATYPWDATSIAALIERADEALLEAKKAGKNRIYLVGGQETCQRNEDDKTPPDDSD